MLILEPFGGLCNRLRALKSAIALSQATSKDLAIIWLLNDELNCRFSGLFDIPPVLTHLWEPNPRKLKRLFTPITKSYFSRFGNLYFSQEQIERLDQEETVHLISSHKSVYMKTCSDFYHVINPYNFVPKAYLQDKISAYSTHNLVGVHIRRQDNSLSTQYSPIEEFIAKMDDEIRVDHEVRFFVATDDRCTEDRLRSSFPERIITHPKRSLSRSNPLAIEDAVVDLYCLAGCRKLIGSYWSSFTDLAWQMNNIDRVIVKQESPAS